MGTTAPAWVPELTDELTAKSEAHKYKPPDHLARGDFMPTEIMIDKEQKISRLPRTPFESELPQSAPLYPKTVIRIRKGSSNGVGTDQP